MKIPNCKRCLQYVLLIFDRHYSWLATTRQGGHVGGVLVKRAFSHEVTAAILKNIWCPIRLLRACLQGGGAQIGGVTCGGSPHLSCKRDQIKIRDYVERRVTHQNGIPHLPGVPHLTRRWGTPGW